MALAAQTLLVAMTEWYERELCIELITFNTNSSVSLDYKNDNDDDDKVLCGNSLLKSGTNAKITKTDQSKRTKRTRNGSN